MVLEGVYSLIVRMVEDRTKVDEYLLKQVWKKLCTLGSFSEGRY